MEFLSKKAGTVTVVALAGSIDATTAGEVSAGISELVDKGEVTLVMDLSGVDYTSSAGLRVLLGGAKETRGAGGDLRLASVQAAVLKVLTLSGFTTILKVFEDTASAVASYA